MKQTRNYSEFTTVYVYRNCYRQPPKKFKMIPVDFDVFSESSDEYAGMSVISTRGRYNKYPLELKVLAFNKMQSGQSVKDVAKEMKISAKNLKRWFLYGPLRKEGCGRKSYDKDMEERLSKWCIDKLNKGCTRISRATIRTQALKLTKKKKDIFKASKGWIDKFVKKYNLLQNKKRSASCNSRVLR